ncbi:MAG: DNA polymerase III subunit delta' [Oceanospirillaceae bacterium]|nr:DNA polymerase III subunit delta' [Oceanospirillaceae bacterium]MCP5349413.1 DNA polymerase III subunit delta' [Oceanospirillaceae bacterium]
MSDGVNVNIQQFPWLLPAWQRLDQQMRAGQLGHAQLFVGQPGIGKRAMASLMADKVLCLSRRDGLACGECASCLLLKAGTHPDFLLLEPEEEGKQIKIDQIRQLTDFVNTTAQRSPAKAVVMGPVEQLNVNAANALLKSLEEPVTQVYLFLFSHRPSGVLPTIRSRCQQVSLAPPPFNEALAWLRQLVDHEHAAQALLLAQGGPLKAIKLLDDQVVVGFMQFCQVLSDIAAGQVRPVEAYAKLKTLSPLMLADWFYLLALDLLRRRQGGKLEHFASLAKLPLYDLPARHLQGFVDACQFAKTTISQPGNANAQLLFENLLIDWLRLLRQSQA